MYLKYETVQQNKEQMQKFSIQKSFVKGQLR